MKPDPPDSREAARHVLYPDLYVWYVFASCLDIMLTYVIIGELGGREVNLVAGHLVERFGHWGLIGLKFSSVILVVGVCELVGRMKPHTGKSLAVLAIVLGAFPVGAGIVQIVAWMR